MKISIIIPVYNVESYVERCVRSVMAQTYGDIECILVGDCSPDGSIAICERLIAEYVGPIQFTILHHEHNRGLSAARNTGTDAATGEYVYYLDSDDEITPDCISLMAAEVAKHPEVEMVTAAVKTMPHEAWYDLPSFREYKYIDTPLWAAYMLNKEETDFLVCAWNKLVSRDFLRKHGISFKEGLLHEDELWTRQVTLHLASVVILPSHTYVHYTEIEGSIMNASSDIERGRRCLTVSTEIIRSLADNPLDMLVLYGVYTKIILPWYTCLPKRDYQGVRREACRFLLRKRKYLTAIYTHFFFKWNLALGLRKYQPQLEQYIMRRYRREEARAARLCGIEK